MAKVRIGTTTGRLSSNPSPGFFDVVAARQMELVNRELSHLAGRDVPAATVAVSGSRSRRRGRSGSSAARARINQLRATGQLGAIDEILRGIGGGGGPQTILNPPRPSPQNPLGAPPEPEPGPGDPDFDVQRSIIENAAAGGDQEALSRALFAASPENPAPIPTRIRQAQDRVNLSVLLNEDPEFIQFAQEQLKATRQQAAKAVNERNAIADFSRKPTTTDAQRDEAWRAHAQRFPGFNTGEKPPTLQELQTQFRQQQLDKRQASMDQLTESLGLPQNLIFENEKGELTPSYDIEQMARIQASMRESQERSRREALRFQIGMLQKQIQDVPDFGTEQDKSRARLQNTRVQAKSEELMKEFIGEEKPQDVRISPQQLSSAQTISNQKNLPLVVSSEDFETLPAGSRFIDAADGKEYIKQ